VSSVLSSGRARLPPPEFDSKGKSGSRDPKISMDPIGFGKGEKADPDRSHRIWGSAFPPFD